MNNASIQLAAPPRVPFYSSYFARCALLALTYFALATFCIYISADQPNHVARIWWPNALVLGVLMRTRRNHWWGYILADIAGNIAANLTMGYHPLLSPALALCDLGEISLCLWLLRRLLPDYKVTLNLRSFLITLGVILGVGASFSATCAALLMHLIFDAPRLDVWLTWWMAECIGMVSLLPIVTQISREKIARLLQPERRWEFLGVCTASTALASLIFLRVPFPFIVMTIPLLIAALRLNFLGTAIAAFLHILVVLFASIGLRSQINTSTEQLAVHTMLVASAVLVLGPLLVSLLIEELRNAIVEVHNSQKLFGASFKYASIGMLLFEPEGQCIRGNPAALQMLGYGENELTSIDGYRIAEPSGGSLALQRAEPVMSGSEPYVRYERVFIRKDGSSFWARVSLSAVRDDNDQLLYVVVQFENIEQRKREEAQRAEMQKELEYRARYDSLTGILNRQSFEHMLGDLLESQHGALRHHSVCFIDLDRFKVLNDSAGHAAGDMLLRKISQELQAGVRNGDILARLGGDEFGILLPDCSAEDARRICAQLIATINNLNFNWEGMTFTVGASIGVVPFSAGSFSLKELMSRVDVACYSAKSEGRNRVVIYDDNNSLAAQNHQQIQVAASIREALETERFALYAQRIMPLNPTIDVFHIEVLVRLRTRNGGLTPPGLFIPAAERYGLMPAIDRWVIANTLLIQGEKLAQFDNLSLSINISGSSFNDADFSDFLRTTIQSTPIKRDRICFEITETAVVGNITQAAQLMRLLKEEGCRVALDDFGSGLSSFNYLKHFPVDVLKIDGSFIQSVDRNSVDRAIVESINQVAHQLGAITVAEFVENENIAECLRDIGIDFAQGYHYATPEPLENILKRLGADHIETEASANPI